MYVCLHICTSVPVSEHVVCVCMLVCVCLSYLDVYLCICVYMKICLYVGIYVYMYVCVYLCVCVYVCDLYPNSTFDRDTRLSNRGSPYSKIFHLNITNNIYNHNLPDLFMF